MFSAQTTGQEVRSLPHARRLSEVDQKLYDAMAVRMASDEASCGDNDREAVREQVS